MTNCCLGNRRRGMLPEIRIRQTPQGGTRKVRFVFFNKSFFVGTRHVRLHCLIIFLSLVHLQHRPIRQPPLHQHQRFRKVKKNQIKHLGNRSFEFEKFEQYRTVAGSQFRNGTCLTSAECSQNSGTAAGTCAARWERKKNWGGNYFFSILWEMRLCPPKKKTTLAFDVSLLKSAKKKKSFLSKKVTQDVEGTFCLPLLDKDIGRISQDQNLFSQFWWD